MSISILNRGGSGGGMKPELTVICPQGGSVDVVKNGVVVGTHVFTSGETEHTFIVGLGDYSVIGTKGSSTKTVNVLIDVVTRYSVTIAYEQYLYYNGNEYTEFTGGFVGKAILPVDSGVAQVPTISRGSSSMTIKSLGSKGGLTRTNSLIDVTPFSSIVFSGSVSDGSSKDGDYHQYWRSLVIMKADGQYWRNNPFSVYIPLGSNTDFTADISHLSGSYYVGIGTYNGPSTTTVTMTKLMLK